MNAMWMPLYIADYLADTPHLRALQSGAYLHLIMHYWRSGGLPDDDAQLSAIAKMTDEEWAANKKLLQSFFRDGWKHKRIDDEMETAKHKLEARAAAGRAGGLAKSKQTSSKTLANSCQSQSQPPSQSQLDHSLKNFSAIGEKTKREGWTPPRHGATGKGRVYIRADHPDWKHYSDDFEAARGFKPKPNEHGGRWFKTLGEASVA